MTRNLLRVGLFLMSGSNFVSTFHLLESWSADPCIGSLEAEYTQMLHRRRSRNYKASSCWSTSPKKGTPRPHSPRRNMIERQGCEGSQSGGSSSDGDDQALSRSFHRLSHQFHGLSTAEIQSAIATHGVTTTIQPPHPASFPSQTMVSLHDKVPGCTSTVSVQTLLVSGTAAASGGESPLYYVSLRGVSDALLSRGLLTLLSRALEGQSAAQVLLVDPQTVADRLGLRASLSRGRNDGLASMMRTVQSQIQSLLDNTTIVTEGVASCDDRPRDMDRLFGDRKRRRPPTVALLLSGGVDSSVALRLLQQQGYNVTAFYLRIWLEDELAHLGVCPWEDDFRFCLQVCQQAGVPLETISLQEQYHHKVIGHTIREAEQGRTPNPDILCNSRIKFGCFYEAISDRHFDFVASGHYAQVVRDRATDDGLEVAVPQARLLRAPDPIKDQSYFLCSLTQAQMSRVLFPIGHLLKSQVRELAHKFELPNRQRPDSQGLCFLGKVKFEAFLQSYLGERPGPIVDALTGEGLGTHRGLWFHTVGQRKGIGHVLHPTATSRGPWFVVAKDTPSNTIFCSNAYDESFFTSARSEIVVENVHWIRGAPPDSLMPAGPPARFTMKVRHGPKLACGSLALHHDGTSGDVVLDCKDSGLAPGQYIAFYEHDECLGGAIISEKHWATFLLDSPHLMGLHRNLTMSGCVA